MKKLGIVLLIFFLGCSAHSGKLSNAVQEATDESDHQLSVTEFDERDDENDDINNDPIVSSDGENAIIDNGKPNAGKQKADRPNHQNWIGFNVSSGPLLSETFTGFHTLDFHISSKITKNSFIKLGFGLGRTPINETHDLSKSLKEGLYLANLGLEYRIFSTSPHTFIGQYFFIGLKGSLLYWRYKYTLFVKKYDENNIYLHTDEVNRDVMFGWEIHGGIGVNIAQTKNIRFGLSLNPGMIIWTDPTFQGFENDVFKNFYYLKLNLEVKFLKQ